MWKQSWKLLALCLPSAALAALVSYTVWRRYKKRPRMTAASPTPSSPPEGKRTELPVGENEAALDVSVSSPPALTAGGTISSPSDSGYTDQSTPLLATSQEDIFTDNSPQPTAALAAVPLPQPPPKPQPMNPMALRGGRVRATIQLPMDIVGRFIGRQGRNIKSLMAESGAQIHVQQKNLSKDASLVPCIIQGTQTQISNALDLITLRHPEVSFPPQYPTLPLPFPVAEGNGTEEDRGPTSESWDAVLRPSAKPNRMFLAIVTYIEKLNRVWLVPYSSTQLLEDLHQSMTKSYVSNESLPTATENRDKALAVVDKFCSVRVSDEYWLRGRIMKVNEDTMMYEVQLMDYGSSVIVPLASIKPLKREHTVLTMQAFPCLLANIEPNLSNSEDGMLVLQALVEGTVLEVHPTNSTDAPTPIVELYIPSQYTSEQGQAFINRELVNQGFATWHESLLAMPVTETTPPVTEATPPVHESVEEVPVINARPTDGAITLPIFELLSLKRPEEDNESILEKPSDSNKMLTEPFLNLLSNASSLITDTPTSLNS